MNDSKEKPVIEYPCEWSFRIIITDEESINQIVQDALKDLQYTLSKSNSSSSGKYKSFFLKTEVSSEEQRDEIFNTLNSNSSVKMIL